jgi:hypothetical protein
MVKFGEALDKWDRNSLEEAREQLLSALDAESAQNLQEWK